jgi:hypothetical protein
VTTIEMGRTLSGREVSPGFSRPQSHVSYIVYNDLPKIEN